MTETSRNMTHAEAADSTIASLLLEKDPKLVVGRDDVVMATLRALAERMDATDDSAVFVKLSTEQRLWWSMVVVPKSAPVGRSIFDEL